MKGVIFDVGQTLLQITPEPEKIYLSVFKEHDINIPAHLILENITRAKAKLDKYFDISNIGNSSLPFLFNMMLLESCGLPKDETLAKSITISFADNIEFKTFPETKDVLDMLYGEFSLGVISNWNLTRELDDVLEKHGLLSYFDCTISSKDIGYEKPHPNIFSYILEKMCLMPSEAYYVGDSYIEDVLGALNMGINPIYVTRTQKKCENKNILCVRDLQEVLDIVF